MARLPRPVTMMISDRPEATASSTTYWIIGLSTRGSISFGCAFVAGRNRVPRPAAGKTALRTFMVASYAWHVGAAEDERRRSRRRSRRCSRARAPPAHALQYGHDRQDARGLDQDEHRLVRRRVLRQERREAERRGEEEDQQYALLLGEPQLLEAMVDVVPARVGEPLRQRMDLPRQDAGDDAEAGSEPVHAVEELDRVGHRDEPEDRQAHVQPRDAGHPVGRDVEDDTVGDRRGGGADVTQELEGGPEIGDVVQDPDRDDDRRPDGDSLELEREVEVDQHGHRERAVDGRSAEKRRRDVVHLPGGRQVEHAPPQRKPPDERRGEERDREREHHQIEPRQTRGVVTAPDRREQEQPHQRQTGQVQDYCSASRSAVATTSASPSVNSG